MNREIDHNVVSQNEINAAMEISNIGFTADLGIQLLRLEPGLCKCWLPLEKRHQNTLEIAHGGVLYSLADTASSLAAASYGAGGTTVQGSIDYLRAVRGSAAFCTAKVVKYGSHLIWTEADILDDQDKLCCRCQFMHYQLDGATNFGIHPVFKENNTDNQEQ